MRILILPLLLISVGIVAYAQNSSLAERNPRYRLQPSDVMEIHYRYTPEFDQTVTIQPDGFVVLKIVGDLKVEGLTVEQTQAAIVAKAAVRLRDPEITVMLKDFEKPYFVVQGEVGSPGRFEMRGHVNPIQAIAMAGGFKNSSKHSQVILFRRVGHDLAKVQLLDLKAATSADAKDSELLSNLHPGDHLVVPQNVVSKIERYIKWANIGLFFNPLAF